MKCMYIVHKLPKNVYLLISYIMFALNEIIPLNIKVL